jgi:hypothetical protein
MKHLLVSGSLLVILTIFSLGFYSDSLAGTRLRTLYINTNPSDKINVTNFDARIVSLNPIDKTVCVIWHVDIDSQLKGEVPLSIDFYDQNNKFMTRHKQSVILDGGPTGIRGQECFHIPEYFNETPKAATINN